MAAARQGDNTPRIAWLAAGGLFLLALTPRLVGLGGFLTIDEIKWIEGAGQFTLALQSGDLARTYWHFFPGITITWGQAIVLWLGRLASGGEIASYIAAQVADPAHTIWLFRLPGALLTATFAPGVYLLTRRWMGAWGATLAGALVALNPFLLAHSRIVNGDAIAAGLMLLSVLAFLVLRHGAGLRTAVLSGVLGGLALLTKLPSPLLVPFVVMVAATSWWRDRRAALWPRAVGVWMASAGLVFVALWPAMWVNPLGTLQTMVRDTFAVGEAGEGHSTFYFGQIVDDPGWGFYPYAVALRLTPVVVVGLASLALALVRRPKKTDKTSEVSQNSDACEERPGRLALALLIYVLFVYVVASLSPKKLDRYLMAVFPALDVLAALGYAQLVAMFGLIVPCGGSVRRVSGPLPPDVKSGGAFPRCPDSPACRTASGIRNSIAAPRLVGALRQLGAWLLIVAVLAVAFVAPHYPYYLSYYNPLLGGIERATSQVPVGWGEGLERAAAWLNAQPEAATLHVASWYSDIFFPFFHGQQVSFSSSGKAQLAADYVVFYVNQVQREKPYPALVRYFQERDAAYTVLVSGVPWAWVYRAPGMRVPTSDDVEVEGRAELLGFDPPLGPVQVGQLATVRLYLHTLGPMPDNETWQVALVDTQGDVLAEGTARPVEQPPDAVVECDVTMSLPASTAPGVYSLRIGVWDKTARRLVARFPVPADVPPLEVRAP
jgi:4-amino-4-deoxy-L-arabinose transferase-like glycosyltransferase